jgi:hypothetical protein
MTRGNRGLARDRLGLLRSVPEFAEDVRLQMLEASMNLLDSASSSDTEQQTSLARDALYTFQELAQLYGKTTMLMCGQAAALLLLDKSAEASAILTALPGNVADVAANRVAAEARLNILDPSTFA